MNTRIKEEVDPRRTGPDGEPNYYDPEPTAEQLAELEPDGAIPQWILDLDLGDGKDNKIIDVTPEYLDRVRNRFAELAKDEKQAVRE